MLLLLKEKDERELRIAYNKYDLLFRSTPAAVFLSEPATGVIHEANPRCTELTGYTPEELIGHSFSEFGLWAPGEHERAENAYCSQGNLQNFEIEAYNRMGQNRVWEVSSAKAPQDDHMFISSSIQDITKRKELQARVNQLLHEKDVLLSEVHHRVRNNLSQIISLLSLQARIAGDQTAERVLSNAGTRVQSMLALYDRIYTERIYTAVSAPDFFSRLIELLRSVFPDTSKSIKVELDIHELSIDPTIMSPLGQLINELFTNSMKHAFGNQNEGTIRIALHQEGDSLLLQYSDDGCGFSPEPADETGKSFGYILIEALAQQLEAEWQLEGPPGTRYSFRFKHVL
ncbi:MAG: PAS domain S-box protein [Spirochaetaceae bacterium]|nr:MAG: PAS domain S-box protein [Spirochaetaceae bacterium]